MIINFVISAIIIIVDQLTKLLIYGTPSRSIIGNFLWFESSLNTGVAFSMFEGMSVLFIVIAFVASGVLIWLIISKKFFMSKIEKISLALILGGTISNAVDRIIFDGVRDFIYLKFMNFAIFNIADMAIVIGAIMLCVAVLFFAFKKENNTEEKEDK